MIKNTVLFVCIHNGARSQMAEAYLNKLAGDRFFAKSAGIEQGKLNPVVVAAMKEDGLDISGNRTKSVDEFINEKLDYVITVCDAASGERCPFFPGAGKRLHWEFRDPSALQGTYSEKLAGTIRIRDEIKARINNWIKEF